MKQYQKFYQLKNAAKDTLDGKYGSAVLILFLSSLISGAAVLFINTIAGTTANTIYYTSGNETAINMVYFVFDLILLAANILLGVMNAGTTLFFLRMSCGQSYHIKDLFYGFQTDSKKILIISATQALCQAICLWPYQYLLQSYLNTDSSTTLLYMGIALVIGLCVYIPVSLSISLAYYFLFDFPDYEAKDTLALCWRMMKGQRMRLFLLDFSFVPLMLLCILSFGIGFLWLNPYMQMTYTKFYLDLMNPAITE